MVNKIYKTRSSAHRAAKAACKKIHGDRFIAYEGPDYQIHPDRQNYRQVFYYKITNA